MAKKNFKDLSKEDLIKHIEKLEKGKKLFGGIIVPKDGSWRFSDSEKYDYSPDLKGWKFLA
jgi:hypothetical protein